MSGRKEPLSKEQFEQVLKDHYTKRRYPRLYSTHGSVTATMVKYVNRRGIDYLLPAYEASVMLTLHQQLGSIEVVMTYDYVAHVDRKSIPLDQDYIDRMIYLQRRAVINRFWFKNAKFVAWKLEEQMFAEATRMPSRWYFSYPIVHPQLGPRLRWAIGCKAEKARHDRDCVECAAPSTAVGESTGPLCVVADAPLDRFPSKVSIEGTLVEESENPTRPFKIHVSPFGEDHTLPFPYCYELYTSTAYMGPPIPARRVRELVNLGGGQSLDCACGALPGERCKKGRIHYTKNRAPFVVQPVVTNVSQVLPTQPQPSLATVMSPAQQQPATVLPSPPLTTTIVVATPSGSASQHADDEGMLPPVTPLPALSAVEQVRAMSISSSAQSSVSMKSPGAPAQPMSISGTPQEQMSIGESHATSFITAPEPVTVQLVRTPRVSAPTAASSVPPGYGFIRTSYVGSTESTLVPLAPSSQRARFAVPLALPSQRVRFAVPSPTAIRNPIREPFVTVETESLKSFRLNPNQIGSIPASSSPSVGRLGATPVRPLVRGFSPSLAAINLQPLTSPFGSAAKFLNERSGLDGQVANEEEPAPTEPVLPISVASSSTLRERTTSRSSSTRASVASIQSAARETAPSAVAVKSEPPSSIFSCDADLMYACSGQEDTEANSAPTEITLPERTTSRSSSTRLSVASMQSAAREPAPFVVAVKSEPPSSIFSCADDLLYDCSGQEQLAPAETTTLPARATSGSTLTRESVASLSSTRRSSSIMSKVKTESPASNFEMPQDFAYGCGGTEGTPPAAGPGSSGRKTTSNTSSAPRSMPKVKSEPPASPFTCDADLMYACSGQEDTQATEEQSAPTETITLPVPTAPRSHESLWSNSSFLRHLTNPSPLPSPSSIYSASEGLVHGCGGTAQVTPPAVGSRPSGSQVTVETVTSARRSSMMPNVKTESPSSYFEMPQDFAYGCADASVSSVRSPAKVKVESPTSSFSAGAEDFAYVCERPQAEAITGRSSMFKVQVKAESPASFVATTQDFSYGCAAAKGGVGSAASVGTSSSSSSEPEDAVRPIDVVVESATAFSIPADFGYDESDYRYDEADYQVVTSTPPATGPAGPSSPSSIRCVLSEDGGGLCLESGEFNFTE